MDLAEILLGDGGLFRTFGLAFGGDRPSGPAENIVFLSPVHTGDKVEFNTVDFVESRQLPKPATNRQQREFDSLSRSTSLPV